VKRRVELLVLALLLGAAGASTAFAVLYVVDPDNRLLGLAIGLALVLLAGAAVVAGKALVPQDKAVGSYHEYGDDQAQEDLEAELGKAGVGVSRRRLLLGAAGTAGAALGAAAVLPAASLGPNVSDRIQRTPWRRGRRVVTDEGQPILASDVDEGLFLNGFPDGADKKELGSPIIIVRVPQSDLRLPPARRAGAPRGIVAFSKICPHAGCAVSMYRHPRFRPTEPRPALVCPCHYSTFDPAAGGKLLFGPAGRALPQLPLRVNSFGELEALDDFFDAIGPSYGGIRGRRRA
jgi:ubiquinol-cytochrome c reductase iron-sulfur subunit